MNLVRIEISKLFGYFDHSIDLDADEQITIITAPNGYGKSVLLSIIKAAYSNNLIALSRHKFKSVRFHLNDGSVMNILSNGAGGLKFQLARAGQANPELEFPFGLVENFEKSPDQRSLERRISDALPWLGRVGPDKWIDNNFDDSITASELINRYPEHFDDIQELLLNIPDWFTDITNNTDVRLIQDQRLIQRASMPSMHRHRYAATRPIDTIEKYARELANNIKNLSVNYSNVAQQLDSSFPSRLINLTEKDLSMSGAELKEQLDAIAETRERLGQYNLIEPTRVDAMPLAGVATEENQNVLALYVQDIKQKFAVYDDMLRRVELFTTILNDKKLSHKKIVINGKGFEFQTEDDEPLRLTDLSSGEQHEVVLLYELIFETTESTLALIDEPEISLHIAWQKKFLDDLMKIIELKSFYAIVSTHSPQIIGENWHLVTELHSA